MSLYVHYKKHFMAYGERQELIAHLGIEEFLEHQFDEKIGGALEKVREDGLKTTKILCRLIEILYEKGIVNRDYFISLLPEGAQEVLAINEQENWEPETEDDED